MRALAVRRCPKTEDSPLKNGEKNPNILFLILDTTAGFVDGAVKQRNAAGTVSHGPDNPAARRDPTGERVGDVFRRDRTERLAAVDHHVKQHRVSHDQNQFSASQSRSAHHKAA